MKFFLVAALMLLTLLTPSYAADDACTAQSMCSQPTGLVRLAQARNDNTTDACIRRCTSFSCRCRCHGTSEFPCRAVPSGRGGRLSCICQ